jgi:hypothetical protein
MIRPTGYFGKGDEPVTDVTRLENVGFRKSQFMTQKGA